MNMHDVIRQAEAVPRFEAAQWAVSQREKIRKFAKQIWIAGYTRGWQECLTKKTNDYESERTD